MFVAIVTSASAFVVVCGVRLALLNSLLHDANQVKLGTPPSAAAVQSTLDSGHTAHWIYLLLFYATYLLFLSWVAGVDHGLADVGNRKGVVRFPSMIVWYVGAVVSGVTVLVLNLNNPTIFGFEDTGIDDYISWVHLDMIVVGVRLLAGCVCVWAAISVYRAADALRPLRRAPDAPYYMPLPLATHGIESTSDTAPSSQA
jgi:hypothetical protein